MADFIASVRGVVAEIRYRVSRLCRFVWRHPYVSFAVFGIVVWFVGFVCTVFAGHPDPRWLG